MVFQRVTRRAVFLTILLLMPGAIASAQKASGPLTMVVDQVTALFPKVEGEVIEVQGQALTLGLGRRDGAREGLELSIYREGRELRHPKTGELLGRTEQTLGRVVLSQIFEAYSIGGVTQGGGILAGDKVRVSAGKVPLTLLILSDGVKASLIEAIVNELIEALNQTGRFQIFQGDQVAVFLAQSGVKGSEALEGKGIGAAVERFRIEQLLVAHLSRAQGKPYMELRLFSRSRPEPALSTALFVSPSIKPVPQGSFSAGGRTRQAPLQSKQRSLLDRILGGELEAGTYSSGESSIPLKETARLGFPVLAMDLSVSPQDKIPRLVMTDGLRIFLYRVAGQALEIEWTYTARGFGRVLSVQLADLDGDGTFEVVANRYHPQPSIGLNSFILAARGGKVAPVVDDVSQILLAVDADGDGIKRALWAQRYSPEAFFTPGQVDRVALRNGSLVHEGPVQVPGSFRATGVTLSSISGKGTRSLAYVDEHDRLRIAVGSEETWRSSSPVGGGDHLKIEVIKQQSTRSQTVFAYMQPTPLSVDLDGDGIEEIVVPQNQAPGHLAVVFRGPTGYRLQSVNSGFEGTITGLGAIPGDERPTLIVAVVRFKGMLRTAGETQIIMTVPEE